MGPKVAGRGSGMNMTLSVVLHRVGKKKRKKRKSHPLISSLALSLSYKLILPLASLQETKLSLVGFVVGLLEAQRQSP